MNDFSGSRIPAAGFERLSKLIHLNLSNSGFNGQIPIAIGKLTSLISLDLSSWYDFDNPIAIMSSGPFTNYNDLQLHEPCFQALVANLTNLRELYLDQVDISGSGEEWCNGLGKAVPHLQVLSMAYCQLNGPIHSSLSNLRSLVVINLKRNYAISGVVPEFFEDFLSLSVLQLTYNSFSGLFPKTIFQLKNLRVLDVSANYQLSGHLPEFPNGTSLKILNLESTNFSGIKLSSFSNHLYLRELGFDGRSISLEPADILINKLNCLQNLNLSVGKFYGDLRSLFSWISSFKNLKSLQISLEQFSGELGPLFSWISNLKNLTSLQLSDCSSSSVMPPLIGNLINLQSLNIISCGFIGQIPPSIGNLNKLISLRISSCAFSGTIPSSLGNLKKLRILEISNCGLSGPITNIGHLSRLKVLVLMACKFSGRIPSTIVNLTQLIHLDLSRNDLRGEIPAFLFTSPTMLDVDISRNQLSGSIQEFDTQYSPLETIYLGKNQINGQIPASLFQLTRLVALDLSSNNLTGLVQLSSLSKLRKLILLNLSNNRLSILDGDVNKFVAPLLPKLSTLKLVSCNMTTIPNFLMHVNHIEALDLSSNKIQGIIPQWIWETWEDSLTELNLSNNIFTHMQLTSYGSRLESLDLSSNRLEGQILLPNLLTTIKTYEQVLDYSNNSFSSIMANFTDYLRQTAYLKLSRNNISGHIPHSICDASNLQVLDLSHNNFSGLMPSCLIEGSSLLAILNLRDNYFEGTFPYNVNEHCNLQTIDLSGNKFQGTLPRSLSNCSDLEVLDIGNNQIVDSFPSWLSRLSNLRILVLRSNTFYGSVDYSLRDNKFGEYFSKLQIIDIASNNLSGSLDSRWFESLTYMMSKANDTGKILDHLDSSVYYDDTVAITYKGQYVTFGKILTALTAIDFSSNALEGDIPESIGRLISLHILNMSHNAFTGRIPPEMGEMSQLESLDLSWNELSGEIPLEMTNLTFLGTLNLCENKLHGSIPQTRQFSTFVNTSYEGNAGLRGPPLSKLCGSSSNPNEAPFNSSGDHVVIILFLFVGVGFGVGFTTGILLKWGKISKWLRIV